MERIEYRTRVNGDLPDGEWNNEPDKIQWEDKRTGMPCLIVRNRMGALCGYVGVTEGHPAFGKGYDDVSVEVHGGLTFAGKCQETHDESKGICHKSSDPRPVWWLGFDTSHCNDLCPTILRYGHAIPGETYKNVAYVTAEVESLAIQLSTMKTEDINAR